MFLIDYKKYLGLSDINSDLSKMKDELMRFRTESLFFETCNVRSKEKFPPMYCLRAFEKNDLPSAYLIYMFSVDENEAALKIVGCLAHWRRLCSLNWFINGRTERGFEGIAQWRLDMAARDATQAKKVLMQTCSEGNVTSAKALDSKAKEDAKSAHSRSTIVRRNKGASYVKPKKEESVVIDFLQSYKKGE